MEFKEWLAGKGLSFKDYTELPFYERLKLGEEFYEQKSPFNR